MPKKAAAFCTLLLALLSLGAGTTPFMYFMHADAAGAQSAQDGIRTEPPVSIPYAPGFQGPELPAGWTQYSSPGLPPGRWIPAGDYAVCFGTEGTGVSRLISPPIDTNGISALSFTGAVFFFPYGPDVTFKLQYSFDGFTWQDAAWNWSGTQYFSYFFDAVANINAPRTYFALALEGDQQDIEAAGVFAILVDRFVGPEVSFSASGELSWDANGSPSYKVYSSDTPQGPWTLEAHTDLVYWQAPMGWDRRFFHVVSCTEAIAPR